MKVIITESQKYRLRSFLLEASKKVKPKKEENKTEKDKSIDRLIAETFSELKSTLDIAIPGSYVTFMFGEYTDGNWDENAIALSVFQVIERDGTTIKMRYETSYGFPTNIKNFPKDHIFYFNTQNSNLFGVDEHYIPYLRLTPQSFKKGQAASDIKVPHFLSCIITKQEQRTNALKVGKDMVNRYNDAILKLDKSMVYEPSFLNMNNFFFFPRGTVAMDKILRKYGLAVNKDALSGNIKIKIKTKDINSGTNTLKLNGEYSGFVDNDGNIIIKLGKTEFIFKTQAETLVRDAEYNVKVSCSENKGQIRELDGIYRFRIMKI